MARPKKQTVDYFPHFVKSGRTIFILESRFGNNGYAFWFKLLEILGEAEGHFYDCSNASNWAFLLAKVRLSENEVNQLINVLIDLGKIDKDLWTQSKIIWVDNFVNNLSEANPQILAEEILKKALENCGGSAVDDMTIIVSKIFKN